MNNPLEKFTGYNYVYSLTHPQVIIKEVFNRIKWSYQRVFWGYDERVVWSVDYYLARMIPVWLKKLKESKPGVPGAMFSNEDYGENYVISNEALERGRSKYNSILDVIIIGFEEYEKIQGYEYEYNSDEWKLAEKKYEQAFDLFREHFSTFWS